MSDIIKDGYNVVLTKNFDSGNMKIVTASANPNIITHYGKLQFNTSPLVGSKFGTVFEIKEDTMIEVDNFEQLDNELSGSVSSKLMTFSEKSQFSQEKIVKKKKKKIHSNIVTAIRPTLLLINEMFYARDKLGGLRLDTLAQMLTLSNIQSKSRCLVVDHNLGLLTSALMSRILPGGICIQLIADGDVTCTTRKTLDMLNITQEDRRDALFSLAIRDLYKLDKGLDDFENEFETLKTRDEQHMLRLQQSLRERKSEEAASNGDSIKCNVESLEERITILKKKSANREKRYKDRAGAIRYLKEKSLDSIVLVAHNDHPLPLLKLSYTFLAPSRQFVIYSDTLEPLLECHQYLKTNSLAVSLNISESWLRRYQVLPDRTRPEMNVSGYGGYLLSGTKALFGPQDGNEVMDIEESA